MSARKLLTLIFAACLAPASAGAQYLTRPGRAWETISTDHFRFHYPAEMRAWVQPIARRMESYATAVNTLVGSATSGQTTVMVEDPSNRSNGFALPLLGGPTIFLWPTPPSPGPTFGAHRGWGEILAIHEYGHIAHLTIPTRSGTERALWQLVPAKVGPVARKSPAWVIEGYATWIEGRLTGNGRPGSAGRAAVLRQWALEGQLPKYNELGSTSPFLGGAMRYLVGSAFFEWLADKKGEASLQHVWRRMSAKERRSFDDAFRGVYGASPSEMYGAFYTEVMEKAFDARRTLRQAGLVQGQLVQRLAWGTDEPAISKDGSKLAIVIRRPEQPSRIVVWSTADEGLEPSVAEARRRMIERDPRDVAPFDSFPASKRALATLHPNRGRSHETPRWFADGERLLVTRDEPIGEGATRRDLFIWNSRSGRLKRVTKGAGIRAADPTPDGRQAAAVRCANGICDLVRIDLSNGQMTTLAAGSPFVVWNRPRVSPDGRSVAAAVQRDGAWHVAIVDWTTGEVQTLNPGDAVSRHSPDWAPDERLVVVSERGGVPNLELIDPETRIAQTLTRVTGAASNPDVGPDGRIWFLALHARGNDLRRIPLRDAMTSSASRTVALDNSLAPVAPPARTAGMTFAEGPVRGPEDYGLGPRGWRVLPGLSSGPDGDMGLLMISNTDPVGRWTSLLQGGYGQRGAWRGGSLATALRTYPVRFEGGVWYTDHAPSEQRSGEFASVNIDSRYTGLGLSMNADRQRAAYGIGLRLGGSVGRVDGNQLDAASRAMGFGEANLRLSWAWRGGVFEPYGRAHASEGGTGGDSWSRRILTAGFTLGGSRKSIRVEGTRGTITDAGPGEFGRSFEQFAVGGNVVPFFDPSFLSQRISLPSVPVGYTGGRTFEMLRGSIKAFRLEPYVVFVAAGDSIGHYQRIYGIENEINVTGIGFARLPSTRIRFGLGYSLDRPYDEKIRPYVSVVYRP